MRTGITTFGPVKLEDYTEPRFSSVNFTLSDRSGQYVDIGIEKCAENEPLIEALRAQAAQQRGEVFVDG